MRLSADVTPAYLANHYFKRGLQMGSALFEEMRWRLKSPKKPPLSVVELKQRLKERFPSIQPKSRGTLNILFAGIGPTTYNEAHVYPALKRFGRLTPFQRDRHPGQCSAPQWKALRAEINREFLDLAENLSPAPDVLLGQMTGWLIDPSTLLRVKKTGIPILNYSWDDTAAFYGKKVDGAWIGSAAFASVADLNLTSSKRSCLKYQAEGGLALFWPEAANPEIHRPYDIPFEYDVSFLGGRYGYRPLLVEFLKKHGVKIAAFGPGWKNGVLPLEEAVALFSRSRINLGFGGIGHMVRIQHLKGRDFEVPMSEGLYLTSYHPELEECYEIGREIVCYKNKWDCLEKIRQLLAHPEEAAAIRKAGRQRALRDHTWEQRFEQLFRLIGLL